MLPADDETHLRMLDAAELLLRRAGYRRYEVSNYALPGRACLHNTACWRGLDYLGFGPAAASRSSLTRRANRPDLGAYLAAVESGADAPAEHERLDARTDLAERLMFNFRMSSGADLEAFCRRFGPIPRTLKTRWERGLRRLEKAGLLVSRRGRWQTTRSGRDMADTVASEFVDAGGFPH
jgi:oxygen-independent coproporphyrinogen-3 oxidase